MSRGINIFDGKIVMVFAGPVFDADDRGSGVGDEEELSMVSCNTQRPYGYTNSGKAHQPVVQTKCFNHPDAHITSKRIRHDGQNHEQNIDGQEFRSPSWDRRSHDAPANNARKLEEVRKLKE